MPMLPRSDLTRGSLRAAELEPLLACTEQALQSWQPVWTDFLDAQLKEEAEMRLGVLSELSLASEGGYPGAERRRLLLQRSEAARPLAELLSSSAGALAGLEISGNFLFDPAATAEFRRELLAAGAQEGEVGDLWLRGERGAQAITTLELARRLDGQGGLVRSVEVLFEARPLGDLSLPASRASRSLTTVEASLRLDAVASAGFGLSRSRMAEAIRQGKVRLNWQSLNHPSRELAVGDRIQLEGRGELEILSVMATKKDRFRVEMVRR